MNVKLRITGFLDLVKHLVYISCCIKIIMTLSLPASILCIKNTMQIILSKKFMTEQTIPLQLSQLH